MNPSPQPPPKRKQRRKGGGREIFVGLPRVAAGRPALPRATYISPRWGWHNCALRPSCLPSFANNTNEGRRRWGRADGGADGRGCRGMFPARAMEMRSGGNVECRLPEGRRRTKSEGEKGVVRGGAANYARGGRAPLRVDCAAQPRRRYVHSCRPSRRRCQGGARGKHECRMQNEECH